MRAVILSAGQGSRLLPHTEGRPKCLLPLGAEAPGLTGGLTGGSAAGSGQGSKTLIEWQIWALTQMGVDDIAVVTGYHAQDVDALLAKLRSPKLAIRTVYNPFYKLADNLASCWMARAEMDRDFIILNGDTVIEPACVRRLLDSPAAPITVTVDRKENGYDADDMKVHRKGTRLLEIGKHLPPERANAESIGMLYFRGSGPKLFTDTLEAMMHTPEGLKWWYLRVIGQIAEHHQVETCSIEGLRWGEVDFPADLEKASQLVTEF